MFSGLPRKAVVSSCLHSLGAGKGFDMEWHEFDLPLDAARDILLESTWAILLHQVKSGHTGPAPVRNTVFPEGFPWLSGITSAKLRWEQLSAVRVPSSSLWRIACVCPGF